MVVVTELVEQALAQPLADPVVVQAIVVRVGLLEQVGRVLPVVVATLTLPTVVRVAVVDLLSEPTVETPLETVVLVCLIPLEMATPTAVAVAADLVLELERLLELADPALAEPVEPAELVETPLDPEALDLPERSMPFLLELEAVVVEPV